ncbi:uncharacterized protein IWZ02DRAFT_489591 [Phyllosticta citriasiana]|uniref:Uncharacterized protein n=1 Tax=Phyllosticta citriasiana TaxID=595635 RepID=A0ABR1KPQ0_9PEZI
MPLLVKLISNGVGLATEAMAHRKASKTAGSTQPLASGPLEKGEVIEITEKEAEHLKSTGQAVPAGEANEKSEPVNIIIPDRVEEDEEVWELDDAADKVWEEVPAEEQPPAYAETEEAQKNSNKRIQTLMDNLAAPPSQSDAARLPYPVILPQRRPREKARGFIRAYAPSLSAAGIDEASFMSFLSALYRESQVHPVFNVIFVGTTIAGFVPDITVMAVCTAIQAAMVPAVMLQTRYTANNFLDRANDAIFRPRGLYAMIVSFKGDTERPITAQPLDINAAIMKYGQASGSKTKDFGRNFRSTSGKTYGEAELPEAAELVFPALDDAAADGQTKEKQDVKEKMRRGSKFVQEYYDRRAQAVFLQENPDSTLLPKDPQFASALSDPTHPAYQGGLVTLLSGGRIQHRGLIRRGVDLYNKSRARSAAENANANGEAPPSPAPPGKASTTGPAPRPAANGRPVGRSRAASGSRARRPPPRRVGLIGSVKKALRQDVMYLMIVNMPSQEEMAKAQTELDKMGQKDAAGQGQTA